MRGYDNQAPIPLSPERGKGVLPAPPQHGSPFFILRRVDTGGRGGAWGKATRTHQNHHSFIKQPISEHFASWLRRIHKKEARRLVRRRASFFQLAW